MTTMTLEQLCNRLLRVSLELEAVVSRQDSGTDEWEALLHEREEVIGQIEEQMSQGEELTLHLREQYLKQIEEANRRILSRMEQRKNAVYQQISGLQQTRLARRQYMDFGPNGYGAFFDQRK